jgi:hypothetical protein
MRRVKDYTTFLKENELLSSEASKKMTRLLNPDYISDITTKSKDQIEASFAKDGKTGKVWEAFEWVEEKGGYVGKSPIFSGDVILKEIDDDGSVSRRYEVTSGTNKGSSGYFTWEGNTEDAEGKIEKYPLFQLPTGKKWSDILGPDEDFLKTFVSYGHRWGSNISEIDGVKLIKVGTNGIYEIEYDDKFQFYGKVRIYYLGNTGSSFFNLYYSYEVKDGPNKGAKGKGLQIFGDDEDSEKTGIYNPFSDGETTLDVIQYPAISNGVDREKKDPIMANSITGGSGINGNQLIFFDTSNLSSIKGPTKEIFRSLYGGIKDYQSSDSSSYDDLAEKNIISGKIEKSKLPSTQIYALQKDKNPVYFTGNEFPPLDGNETSECYISHYQGHPLILYTVKCQKKNTPSFDNKGIGTYGNNFFVGIFYNDGLGTIQVRGEWYYDYSLGEIGIIYAYSVFDKKEITGMTNPLFLAKRDFTKPDFTNPKDKSNKGILIDPTGGIGTFPKPKEIKIPSISDYWKKK